ncbi:hypothetical protein ACQ4PT_041907 [Festuca glaucescens]
MRTGSKRRARGPATDPPVPPPSRCRRLDSGRNRKYADILRGARLVCASWWRVTLDDPLQWRRIDLAELAADKDEDGDPPAGWRTMVRAAVRRSAGLCESFRGPVDGDFLLFLVHSAPSLRSLEVACQYHIHKEELITSVAKKLPLVERIVLSRGLFEQRSLVALVRHSPRLQLLYAGGCFTYSCYGDTLRAWMEGKVRDLRLPHQATWNRGHFE